MATLGQSERAGELLCEEFETASEMSDRCGVTGDVGSRQHHVGVIVAFTVYLAFADRRAGHRDGAAEMGVQ